MNTLILSRSIALALAIVIPLSSALTTITSLTLTVLCLPFIKARYFKNPVAYAILIFLGWMVIESFVTIGTGRDIEQMLRKSARLLYIPLFAPLFLDFKWRRNMHMGFVGAVVLSVIAAYSHESRVVFRDNIFTSFFCAYCAFILAHYAYDFPKSRWITISVAAFVTYFLFFINVGRSGHIIFLILTVVYCVQRYGLNWKKQLTALAVVLSFLGACTLLPSAFMTRQRIAMHEVKNYDSSAEDKVDHQDSMGVRLILARNTWKIINDRPIFGWGTGSYKTAYAENAPEARHSDEVRANPHNQYLFTWAENGIIGLISLLGVFGTMLYTFYRCKNLDGYLGVGLVISVGAGCFVNSWLFDFVSMYFFVFFGAICFGGLFAKKDELGVTNNG